MTHRGKHKVVQNLDLGVLLGQSDSSEVCFDGGRVENVGSGSVEVDLQDKGTRKRTESRTSVHMPR